MENNNPEKYEEMFMLTEDLRCKKVKAYSRESSMAGYWWVPNEGSLHKGTNLFDTLEELQVVAEDKFAQRKKGLDQLQKNLEGIRSYVIS